MSDSDQSQRSYYHACAFILGEGSIVEPGNWGRILGLYKLDNFARARRLAGELAFEAVRARDFPDKPSRLRSVFLCESEETITEFLRYSDRPLDLVYEVRMVDTDLPMHRACFTLPGVKDGEQLGSLEERARVYWEGNKIEKAEVLTASAVQIVKRVELKK